MNDLTNRRPIRSREAAWAKAAAAGLARAGASPDLISATSVAVAVLGAALLMAAGTIHVHGWLRTPLLVLAAGCIQLRLVCNLLDGMVAVEYERRSKTGPIWNELPDRIADALLLVGAGYGAHAPLGHVGESLGWLAATLAILTAYIRELGRGLGQPADFSGPMAKPQRMAVLTAACLIAVFEPTWGGDGQVLLVGLMIIVIGTAWTAVRRTRNLAEALKRAE